MHLVYHFKPTFIFRDTLDLTGLQGHPAGNLRQGDGRNRGPIPGTQSLSTRKKVFGKIVALGSFNQLSELYRSASAAKKTSSAQRPVAESAHRQLRGLFDGKIVSLNRLEKSKIDWIAARSWRCADSATGRCAEEVFFAADADRYSSESWLKDPNATIFPKTFFRVDNDWVPGIGPRFRPSPCRRLPAGCPCRPVKSSVSRNMNVGLKW
jgi:hypothetical protein